MSQIAYRGSLQFEAFILWMIEEGRMIPDYILDNTRIIEDIFKLGLKESASPNADTRELPDSVYQGVKDFQSYLTVNNIEFPTAHRWTGDSQTIVYLTKQYLVNLKNGILENFFKRQKDFLRVSSSFNIYNETTDIHHR